MNKIELVVSNRDYLLNQISHAMLGGLQETDSVVDEYLIINECHENSDSAL